MCLLRLPSHHRGYRYCDLSYNKIIICYHIIFDETQFSFSKLAILKSTTKHLLDNSLSLYMINHLIYDFGLQNHLSAQVLSP